MVTFVSTAIEVTRDTIAMMTGDLTMNDVTKSVVLDAIMNQASNHPMQEAPWAGFDATTIVLRSDFNVGDEVQIMISIEAMKTE